MHAIQPVEWQNAVRIDVVDWNKGVRNQISLLRLKTVPDTFVFPFDLSPRLDPDVFRVGVYDIANLHKVNVIFE